MRARSELTFQLTISTAEAPGCGVARGARPARGRGPTRRVAVERESNPVRRLARQADGEGPAAGACLREFVGSAAMEARESALGPVSLKESAENLDPVGGLGAFKGLPSPP